MSAPRGSRSPGRTLQPLGQTQLSPRARRALAAVRAVAAAIAFALALGALLSRPARASCGAESCPLDRNAPAAGARLSLGLDWEYVRQDQVRVGTAAGIVGELPSPENEVRTVSRVATATVHAQPFQRWRFDLSVPFVSRSHAHDALEDEARLRRRWDYSGPGDAMLAAGWRATPARAPFDLWLRAGAKAPTGARSVPAVGGEEPEPSARPGTGSWDAILGLHAMRRSPSSAADALAPARSVFASLEARWNGRGTEDYRLGRELQASLGASRSLAGPLTGLAQVNLRLRGRDTPGRTDALAANTGGTWLFVSPGVALRGPHGVNVSVDVQLPVYQRVNRIQIVAPWMLLTGVSWGI